MRDRYTINLTIDIHLNFLTTFVVKQFYEISFRKISNFFLTFSNFSIEQQ